MCEATRTDAHPVSETAVHLELRDVPSRCTLNETNRDPDNNVALSTRAGTSTRRHNEDFVLPRARACQSIIRIGLLKFLGTDGERMDIHSFGPALTKANSPVRSCSVSTTYTCTDICFPTARAYNRSTRESSLPFNFVTYACPLNCFGCRRALRHSMRLCPHRHGSA